MNTNYSVLKEVKNTISLKILFTWLLLMSLPLIYFAITRNNYIFEDSLSVFTHMLEGILPLLFPIIATIIYLGSFSQEIKNRFLVYTRLRIPLKKLLLIKFSANFVLSFSLFFIFTFAMFLFSFYIEPLLGIIRYDPDVNLYSLNGITVEQKLYTRHTFTQLLQYGSLTYGLLYSCWLGINAAAYASLGFFLLILLGNQFLALSIPTLIYLLGGYLLDAVDLGQFDFRHTLFPYSRTQQPIWTAFVPFLFLVFVSTCLYVYIKKHFHRLDNLL